MGEILNLRSRPREYPYSVFKCTWEVRSAKKEHELNIAKKCKLNPKVFWKYVRSRFAFNSGISPLDQEDGSMAVNDEDKANRLNRFFSSVFTTESTDDIPNIEPKSRSDGISLNEIIITPKSVQEKLTKLNPAKSFGPDGIPSRVLKEASKELSTPLCILFNKSLEYGVIPQDWKRANVTAIFKKGKRSDPGNYRPVSLTCILSKVLELSLIHI